MIFIRTLLVALVVVASNGSALAEEGAPRPVDILRYDLAITPDLAGESVTGVVAVSFVVAADRVETLGFDAGSLTIESVQMEGRALSFQKDGQRLNIVLPRPLRAKSQGTVEIHYHGMPTRGIRFFPESDQIYTVFATSQWMVCVDAPDERAAVAMEITVPAAWSVVANGHDIGERTLGDRRVTHRFRLDSDVPSYTYGFAAGRFQTITEHARGIELRYVADGLSAEDLRRVFRETPAMLDFFAERAGIPYPGDRYTQVLAAEGNPQQEMSGFSMLPEAYGRQVLAGHGDVVLAAHELAHQWWGNDVTNRDWTHFWLNEGMATFMAAAYVEHRSGREAYVRMMDEYRASYERVRDADRDKPLVFSDWLHPTADDRTLVYRKGAYVLHLLREELGDPLFWNGIRTYTRQFAGRSVVSADFRKAMERATGRDLTSFFARWVD